MKKIDIHLHLTLEQMPRQDKFFLSSAQNMLPHLAELGIARGILMSSGEGKNLPQMPGRNDECKAIAEKFPEVYAWMCNLDEEEDGQIYERLAACQKAGAVGIGELMINKRLDHPFFQKLFRAAEQLHMPVLFHMSPQEGYEYGVADEPGLPLLEENLKRYPELVFIGHSQPFWHEISGDAGDSRADRMEWGTGKVLPGGRVPYLFDTFPNLYGDLSANSGGCAIMRDEEFGLQFLERYQERLLFGTDMVNTEMEFPLGKWLDKKYENGRIRKEAYENICYRNALKLFGWNGSIGKRR